MARDGQPPEGCIRGSEYALGCPPPRGWLQDDSGRCQNSLFGRPRRAPPGPQVAAAADTGPTAPPMRSAAAPVRRRFR